MSPKLQKYILLPPMLFAAAMFLLGITWGLPSRKADPFLFGNRPVWSGKEIVDRLGTLGEAASAGGSLGADVDPNAPNSRARPLMLNDTDAKRAEILVRYRLYSYQPDEMITFRSLATIPKTHGDPRLYQYGGLWIYPVGVLLRIGSILHLVDVRSDLAFYLDHPEAFGRFYIVARLYVVAFAMAGVWAVFWLAKRMSGEAWVAMMAAIVYAQTPIVLNLSHEAKPHLPSAVLSLFAVIAAVKYIETASRRWALIAGALCGAAFGMVLTGMLSFILLPVMCFFRWRARSPLAPSRISSALSDLGLSLGIGVVVYAITNPFVIIHLLGDRTILLSNLGNSQAMYRAPMRLDTIATATDLIAEGASPLVAGAGLLAVLFLRGRNGPIRTILLLVSLPILAQFIALATDKPGEYARFAVFPDIALALCAVDGMAALFKGHVSRTVMLGGMCALSGIWSAGYTWHFERDAAERTPRIVVAERLAQTLARGAKEMAVYNDPAPYCLPPVNLFDWKIVLVDPGAPPSPTSDLLIKPVDRIPRHDTPMLDFEVTYWVRPRILDTPITWASKSFRAVVRKSYLLPEPPKSEPQMNTDERR
jgi:hypothetical protein